MEYIIDNLLQDEKDIFNIIKNNFYDKLKEKNQIKEYVDFTSKMHLFFDEESYLWKNLIEKDLDKEYNEEENIIFEKKIENELSNLEILKKYSWPMENFTKYYQILNDKLKNLQLINSENELKKLKNKLINLNVKGGLEIYKDDYIESINKLLRNNLDEILANKKAREIEVNELIEVSKEKELPLLGNDINWGNQIINKGHSFESLTVKLLSSMLYYAEYDELVQKYLDIKDNKERMRYGIRLEKLGLKSLLKYINSSKNKILYAENKKIIKSMYRVELMLKIWNDSIDQLSLVNFIKNLNDKALRNKITNEEYIYTYQISSK